MTTDQVKEVYNKYTDLPSFSYKCIKYLLNNNDMIWKLLYYTDKDAYKNDSTHPNLTKTQKGNLIYDGSPDQTPYRVFLDVGQDDSWSSETCILRVSPSELIPTNYIYGYVSMAFQVLAHSKINTLSNYTTRVISITQQLIESLNGENIDGIGRIYFDNRASRACKMNISGQTPFKGAATIFCNWIT
jgi:hypothetical protein